MIFAAFALPGRRNIDSHPHESGTGTMLIAQVDVENLMLMAYFGSRQAMCALFSMPKDVWRIAEQSFQPSWRTQPRKNTL